MMMCPPQPVCGSQGVTTGSSIGTVLGDLGWLFGAVGTAGTLIGFLGKTAIFTLWGISAATVIWLAAIAGALITFAVVFDFYRLRCLSHPDTRRSCSSGVVEQLVPAFNGTTSQLFPFTAQHDRVDVVVKCVYWPLVVNNAAFVHCNSDPDSSPILRGYFHNAQVCAAGLGSTVGAGVGIVAGILLGCLAGIAIGCATVILCIFAILLALIVAAVTVLVAALIGGQIGMAAAGSSAPTASGNAIQSGDYITTKGGLLTSGDDDGARVYWFVDPATLHGHSALPSPHDHTDPDMNLIPDAC